MDEKIKIISFSLFSGLFATFLLFYCIWQMLKVTIPHINIMGGQGTQLSSNETIIFYLSALGVLVSIFICPITAYFLRTDVYDLVPNSFYRFFIIATIACLQIILSIFCFYGLRGFEDYKRHKSIKEAKRIYEPHRILINKLDNADVNVFVKKARILNDDGKYINAEITLQIENVPLIIPYYHFNVNEVDENEGFLAGFTNRENKSNTCMRVVNQKGKWVFQDFFSSEIISVDANEIKIPIEIIRSSNAKNHLPKTITPRLSISAGKDKVYLKNHNFYYKSIPINFEH